MTDLAAGEARSPLTDSLEASNAFGDFPEPATSRQFTTA